MKKIIYIINGRLPTEKAYGHQVSRMCEKFAETGAGVELWAPTRKNNIRQDIFSFHNVKRNFKVRMIKSFDFLRFAEYLGRFSYYLQILEYFFRLTFKKIDKDSVIYTRSPEIAWLFKLKGAKTAYECHDWFGKNKKISLFFLKNCSHIITTNNYIKNEFAKRGFNNVLTAPNGIDLKTFAIHIGKNEALESIAIDESLKNKLAAKKMLLYTGSFRTMGADKGIGKILEAMRIINDKDLIFIAVGGSAEDIKRYEESAEAFGLGGRVYFLPRRSQKELALFQRIADILLMPFPDKAHFRYFMTPLKMLEYMASKRPIIASDLPSIREILNDDNCLFCRPDGAGSLAEKIKLLLNDKVLARRIAEQAYGDAQNYTWEQRAESILRKLRQP